MVEKIEVMLNPMLRTLEEYVPRFRVVDDRMYETFHTIDYTCDDGNTEDCDNVCNDGGIWDD